MQGRSRTRFSPIADGELELVGAAIRTYGVRRFARDMEVHAGSIENWFIRGVPAERVLDAEILLGLPRAKIRPDIYGVLPAPRKKELQKLRAISRQVTRDRQERMRQPKKVKA